jgi:hypothetical protein
MLVMWAGTPRSSKPAESDLMKVPAQVVTPISNVSIATRRKEKGMTYLKGLKDCSDDGGKGRP